jgi:surface protein/YD repeat-containing protein
MSEQENCFNKLNSDLPKNLNCCPIYPRVSKNSANFSRRANWNNSYKLPGYLPETSGNLTTVGTNGTHSYYLTYDQTGNVSEINDTTVSIYENDFRKIRRGGSWASENPIMLSKDFRDNIMVSGYGSDNETNAEYSSYIGFRLSTTGDPLTYNSHGNLFVTIGDTGNPSDTTGFGNVDYIYKIMQFPITNNEYIDFLNSVDPSGINNRYLYSTEAAGWIYGGVEKTGSYPTPYSAKSCMGNKPVNYVSWFDAARFSNWLHNKVDNNNVTGDAATEDGAYTLNGAMSGIFEANPSARYKIPTENEWYKAAYYNGSGYYTYATQSNILPIEVCAEPCGDAVGCDPLPTPTKTPKPTTTPTVTPTHSPTQTRTPSVTPTNTTTNTNTPSVTPTNTTTPSITPTHTITPTISPTNTVTPSVSPTNTRTPTLTPTVSPTNTVTPSISPTNTATPTATITSTPTSSITPTRTSTLTPTSSITATPTLSPTITRTNTTTPTISPTNTITPSITPTNTRTPTLTPTSSLTPTLTRTPTTTTTLTRTPTRTTTTTPTPSSSPVVPSLTDLQMLVKTRLSTDTSQGNPRTVEFYIVGKIGVFGSIGIDWGDGSVDYVNLGSGASYAATHTYEYFNQLYTISIKPVWNVPDISRIEFYGYSPNYFPSNNRIIKIISWGQFNLTRLNLANLTSLTDVPKTLPLSVTNIEGCFRNCTSLENIDLSGWDMTSIVSFQQLFKDCIKLKTIGSPVWSTPYLKYTNEMFSGCSVFNDNVAMDIDSVIDANNMFYNCLLFNNGTNNNPINNWNTSNIINMGNIFNGASSFSRSIVGWNTNKVTNITGAFYNATSFNQDISSWSFIRCLDLNFLGGTAGKLPVLSQSNYDALLNNFDATKNFFPTNRIYLNAPGCRPSSIGQGSKTSLATYGWYIVDAEGIIGDPI